MKRLQQRASMLASAMVMASLACGCDPEGPGAAGKISLDPSVQAAGYSILQIRAYADPAKDYDASKIPASPPAQANLPMSEVKFPYQYSIGEGVGASDEQHWRMVAWLSHDAGGSNAPVSGDPQCNTPFDLKSCSGGVDGYCTVSSGVDCTLK